MQKLIVLGIIVMMITGCSVAANAYAGVLLNLQPVASTGSFQTCQIGWYTDNAQLGGGVPTVDGVDTSDYKNTNPSNSNLIEMDVVDPAIGTGTWQDDYKAPITVTDDSQAKIWRLKNYIANNPDEVGATIGLTASFVPGYLPMPSAPTSAFYILDGNFSTQAACRTAIGYNSGTGKYTDTGAAILAKLTSANAAGGYNSGATTWSIGVPVLNEDEGTYSTPTRYFTVYAIGLQVPEPGSLLAMFSGLIGLVGFGIRRRK
jgi:hypothetical protein